METQLFKETFKNSLKSLYVDNHSSNTHPMNFSNLFIYYDNNSNSIKYEGVFENNKYNGNGSLYFPNGNFAYQGDWVNGVKHGQGSSYY